MSEHKVTREWAHNFATYNGNGFTRRQVAILGGTWPPAKGWLSSRIGSSIAAEDKAEFEAIGLKQRAKYLAKKAPHVIAVASDEVGLPPAMRADMSLRDHFAGLALPAIYEAAIKEASEGSGLFSDDQWRVGLALDAYSMADAMLIARSVKDPKETTS